MRITTVFKLGRLFAVRRMADAFEAVPRVFFCYNDLIWLCACGVYLAIADIYIYIVSLHSHHNSHRIENENARTLSSWRV